MIEKLIGPFGSAEALGLRFIDVVDVDAQAALDRTRGFLRLSRTVEAWGDQYRPYAEGSHQRSVRSSH